MMQPRTVSRYALRILLEVSNQIHKVQKPMNARFFQHASHTGFCYLELIEKVRAYLNETIGFDASSSFQVNILPTDVTIGYAMNSQTPLTYITVPTSILCSNCYKKLCNPYLNYTSIYPLD